MARARRGGLLMLGTHRSRCAPGRSRPTLVAGDVQIVHEHSPANPPFVARCPPA